MDEIIPPEFLRFRRQPTARNGFSQIQAAPYTVHISRFIVAKYLFLEKSIGAPIGNTIPKTVSLVKYLLHP